MRSLEKILKWMFLKQKNSLNFNLKGLYIYNMTSIRFRFSPQKAFSALHWMVNEHPGIDLHAALKACYFADKSHLNAFHRPIFGATYKAMKFGPVPLEIYEMSKGEALWLAEIGSHRLPWRIDGFSLLRTDVSTNEDRSCFADSEKEHFAEGLRCSQAMTFNERTAATHGQDWQNANFGIMFYEDMIVDGPDKEAIVAYLQENARFMRL